MIPNVSHLLAMAPFETEIIDDEGDVVLQSGSKEFHVSRKVLTLASPRFKTLFKSPFSEAQTLASADENNGHIKIILKEDDDAALAILLHVLHYSNKREYKTLDLDMQYRVAVVSDKYQCISSMSTQTRDWLRESGCGEFKALSLILKSVAVAHLTRQSEIFLRLVERRPGGLLFNLEASDLEGEVPEKTLPSELRGTSIRAPFSQLTILTIS